MRRTGLPRTWLVLVALAALGSCSLEYGETELAAEISEDTPDTILFQVRHTIVRDGSARFIVDAGRAETFSRQSRQYLSDVRFREIAADGETVTDGTADYAEYQTDTEDLELTGNLRFYSSEEDAWLTAEYLYWNSESRLLTSEPSEPVVLERGDGTTISGRGFVAEMARSIIRFEEGVSGTLVEEDEASP